MEQNALKSIFSLFGNTAAAQTAVRPLLPKLAPGQTLALATGPLPGQDEGLLLNTKFEGFDENRHLIAAAPIHKGRVVGLVSGTACAATYMVEGTTYGFNCRTRPFQREGKLDFVLLEPTTSAKEIERRDAFRLRVSLPCCICRCAGSEEATETSHEAKMLDISGGGARVTLPVLLARGEQIYCVVPLGEQGEKTLTSTVRWSGPLGEDGTGTYKAGLQFSFANSKEQDSIVRFVFSEQNKRRHSR